MLKTRKVLLSWIIFVSSQFASNFSFGYYGIDNKESFLIDKAAFWEQVYQYQGRDNNGIDHYLVEGQSQINETIKKYHGKLLTEEYVVVQALKACVLGAKGAYGQYLDDQSQKELVDFLFGADLRHLKDQMSYDNFYILYNHPADIAATSDDGCAIMITPKESVFLNDTKRKIILPNGKVSYEYDWAMLGRVLQSYIMD